MKVTYKLNLENLKPSKNIDDIYEFYALHNYIIYSDNYLFKSFEKFQKEINFDLLSDKVYEYFMDNPESNLKRYKKNCIKFLSSKYRYLFEEELSNV